MEKEFVRVRSARDIVISALLAVCGIVLIALPTSVSVNIFGTCLAVPGVLMLLFLKTDYMDPETGEHYKRVIKYYAASRKNDILTALKNDPSKLDWKETDSANGLMIDIYVSRSSDDVVLRASEFIPYSYVPCSDWFSFKSDSVAKLLA